jgi:hypothetical protein
MNGPRKIDGAFQQNPTDARKIRVYAEGSGSAKDAVCIDTSTTTHGYFHMKAAGTTSGDEALLGGVALQAWDDDPNNDGNTIDQIIEVQVEGICEEVNVASTVAAKDPLVASGTAGRLQEVDLAVAGNSQAQIQAALHYTVLGIALTNASSNKSTVRLLNPLRL